MMFLKLLIANDTNDGPFYVKPIPPFCSQNNTNYVCFAASGSMMLKYWNEVKILNYKTCEEFQKEIAEKLGNSDGSFIYEQEMDKSSIAGDVLVKVAKNNLTKEYKGKMSISYVKKMVYFYNDMKKQLKYSKENDKNSTWDRAGVIISGITGVPTHPVDFRKHTVLVFGCEKEIKDNKRYSVIYYIKDPRWNREDEKKLDVFKQYKFTMPKFVQAYAILIAPEKKSDCEKKKKGRK